jgi:GNAT superfamily N-acetyltransferase
MSAEPAVRAATRSDIPELAHTVAEGFASFRDFAPAGWTPPSTEEHAAGLRERFADPGFFCLVAEAGGEPAGHVAFMAAARSRAPTGEPGLAHLYQLFVRRPWWGAGVAARLHALALDEASARGFATVRLFTPALQARARRFYEREGWTRHFGPFEHTGLGLQLVEYRLQVHR